MQKTDLKTYLTLTFDKQLDIVTQLRGSKKIDHIISSPNAIQLTHKLSAEDVYLTIKEVGDEDALPLFELTNFQQAQYVYDLEWWNNDQMDPDKIVFWLSLMLESPYASKLLEWVKNSDVEDIVAVFQRLIRVHVFDNIDELKGDIPEMYFFTIDNVFYIDFINEEHEHILKKVIVTLRDRIREEYYHIMEGMVFLLVNETEEGTYEKRIGRMEERGFPVFEEAMNIYQPLSKQTKHKFILGDVSPRELVEHSQRLNYALVPQKRNLFFSTVLNECSSETLLNRIRFELVHLSHKILIADNLKPEYKELQHALKKAYNMINVGLERHCTNIDDALTLLDNNFLEHVFRSGFEPIQILRVQLERLLRPHHSEAREFWLQFLAQPRTDIVKSLLKPRPLCNLPSQHRQELLERDFEEYQDVLRTEMYCNQVSFIIGFFRDRMGFRLDMPEMIESPLALAMVREIDWHSLINTIFIHYVTKNDITVSPLSVSQLSIFFESCYAGASQDHFNRDHLKMFIFDQQQKLKQKLYTKHLLKSDEEALFSSLLAEASAILLDQCDGIAYERNMELDYRLFPGLWFQVDFKDY